MSTQNVSYTEEMIQVLEGIEHVRARPSMYIGDTTSRGLHHLIWEIVDNSIDEAMAGFARMVHVRLNKDGSCTVSDDGRGIPVGIHPTEKIPTVELVFAKLGASADVISGGRFAVNVVSGWFKGEFHALGEPWLEHDERYRRSEEFIRVLKASWTQDEAEFSGDFYNLHGYTLKPKPLQKPHPQIFQGGNSTAARQMAGRVSDWYFMNGGSKTGMGYRETDWSLPREYQEIIERQNVHPCRCSA